MNVQSYPSLPSTPVPDRSANPPLHWPSVAQLTLSILAIMGLWGAALSLGIAGLSQYFAPHGAQSGAQAEGLSVLAIGMGFFVIGALIVPSAVLALCRLAGWKSPLPALPEKRSGRAFFIFGLPLLFGMVVGAGALAVDLPAVAWLAMPVLHVLAIGLPIFWLLYLGRRKLSMGSPQREWGVLASGLTLGPGIILLIELAAMVVFGAIAGLALLTQPDLLRMLQEMAMTGTPPDPETLQDLLLPYLTNRWVALGVLSFASLLVPLIEEAFKPIGVWLLAGRKLTPAAGFVGGLLSGAAFAFFESLSLAAQGPDWALQVSLRVGAAVIHIFNSGLMGWAIVTAFNQRRFARLLGVYLLVVAIHGLWNGLALVNGFYTLLVEQGFNLSPVASQVSSVAAIGLVAIAITGALLLPYLNRRFRQLEAD